MPLKVYYRLLFFFFLFLFDYLFFWYAMKCLKICENEFVPFLVSGNNINRTIVVP